MITAFLTFLFFFAIIGCILYGRKLIRTEKVDAVFAFGDLTRHTIHAMNGVSIFHQFYDDKTSLLTDLKEFLMELCKESTGLLIFLLKELCGRLL